MTGAEGSVAGNAAAGGERRQSALHDAWEISDPAVALEIEVANSRDLKLPSSLADLAGRKHASEEVTWREVRALLVRQSRQLTAPTHLEALRQRMHAVLAAEAGRQVDLTLLTGRVFSESLLPLIVGGLPARAARRILMAQRADFRRLTALAPEKQGALQKLRDLISQAATGRAIARHLERRLRGAEPMREDYAAAVVPLVERVGPARAGYLVATLLAATGTPPGLVASCILYELVRRPDWRDRLRSEFRSAATAELYRAPAQAAPIAARFIKEAMRLWPFPLVTQRKAYRDIDVAGINISAGSFYALCPYAMHHSERLWRDPERFDPDRWMSGDTLPAAPAYVPFGFGPRSCVGASLGFAQLILFCELVSCTFEVELAPGARPEMSLEGFAIPRRLLGRAKLRSE